MCTFHFDSKGDVSHYLWKYTKMLIADAYQEKISTVWPVCEKQHPNLTWFVVGIWGFFISKADFFLRKGCIFSTGVCLDSSFIRKAFSGSEENSSALIQEKSPQVSTEQSILPNEVKHRFKPLFFLTWFSSLPDECLDCATEKREWVSLFSCFFFRGERLRFSCSFPASSYDELIDLKRVVLQYCPTLERAQDKILP